MAQSSEHPPGTILEAADEEGESTSPDGFTHGNLLDHPFLHGKRRSPSVPATEQLLEARHPGSDSGLSADVVAKLVAQDLGRLGRNQDAGLQKLSRTVADITQAAAEQGDPASAPGLGEDEDTAILAGGHGSQWVGLHYDGGYVVVRRRDPTSFVGGPRAALARLLPRSMISHPPLIPNSSSRFLIWLIIICIIAMGIVTVTLQEVYSRWRAASPSRRRRPHSRSAGQTYFDQQHTGRAPVHRLTPTSARSHLTGSVGALSVDDEEALITTPPAISRRSSARSIQQSEPDASDEEESRQTNADLHYFALPLGLGIGYSYTPIDDRKAAKVRLDKIAEASARKRRSWVQSAGSSSHSRSPSAQLAALPVTGSKATGTDVGSSLRARARSFRDLCTGALTASSMTTMTTTATMTGEPSYASSISDEGDGISPTTPSSLPLWNNNGSVSEDLTPMATNQTSFDYWTATSTPANDPSLAGGSIPLDELGSVPAGLKGKARASRGETPDSYTLVDLTPADLEPDDGAKAYAIPELVITNGYGGTAATPSRTSEEDGSVSSITSSPPSSAVSASSTVARHPLVEHLRREGRIDGERRVGNGTPTSKPLNATKTT